MVDDNQGLVSYIGEMILQVQLQAGVDKESAKSKAEHCIMSLLLDFGGQKPYIQTVKKLRRTKIVCGWKNGETVKQLANQFEISERQVYNIVSGA